MRWYLFRAGAPEGPFDEQALVELIRSGQVGSAAQVCPEGGNAWQPVFSHPPFAQAGQGGSPQPGPPQSQGPGTLPKTVPLSAHQLGQVTAGGGAAPAAGGHGSAPGFAGAPGAPAASAAPAGGGAPPKNKSKLPLIIGGGCGLLVVLTLCAGGGIFAYFELQGGAFADATLETADDIVAAAEGRAGDVSDTWTAPPGQESLLDTGASERSELGELAGEPETVLAGVSMAAYAGDRAVQTIVVVFPDGTVRYSGLKARNYRADILGPPTDTPRTSDVLTSLDKGVDEFLELAETDCEGLELVTREDLEGLPDELTEDILEDSTESNRREVCSEVSSRGRTAFGVSKIDGMVVLRQGDRGKVAGLQTRVGSPDGNPSQVFLSPVRVKIFD